MQIADIQRFCTHDGPGIRTTVFLKGCPLRCAWCHNPEDQNRNSELLFYKKKCIGCGACTACAQGVHNFTPEHQLSRELCIGCGICADNCPTMALELIGKDYTVRELFEQVARDAAFYGETGGVTLSGGEPLMQIKEAAGLLELCRKAGIHTAVETCGYADDEAIRLAVGVTDLFLWDIKDTDPDRHLKYTGVSNEQILHNLKTADSMGAKTRIRCILVNGVNTEPEHYERVAAIVSSLRNCEGVEFIPYHTYGGAKAMALRGVSSAKDEWIPDKARIAFAKNALRGHSITVF